MTELEKAKIALMNVIKDFEMLKDGSWEPDDDSIQCSLDNAEFVYEYLKTKTT